MKMHCSQPGRNSGLSIVELLVAVTIGLLLMTGAISIFMSNKTTYEITDDLSRLQENARYAIATMARDIRMVGFFGCADNALAIANQLTITTAGNLYDVSNAVEGFEQGTTTWVPSASTDNIGGIVADSDAITVRYLEGVGDPLNVIMTAKTDNVVIIGVPGLEQGDIVAVNDCSSADILQVTQITSASGADGVSDTSDDIHTLQHIVGGSPGNSAASLGKEYGTDATVSRMGTARYFVGTGASGEPSLFRTRFFANAGNSTVTTEELVEGVETMQILYGVDNVNGDRAPDTYMDATAVETGTQWPNVVTVRVGLLMRTVDAYGQEKDDTGFLNDRFNVAGTVVCRTGDTDPVCDQTYLNDRRRRRMFETTLAMRNLQ